MSFPGKITQRSVAACGGEVQRADGKERNLGLVVITGSPDFGNKTSQWTDPHESWPLLWGFQGESH
ncbi:unnamed protein product [Fusarium venenatum]|uniref:Uncharacterized protein n=1 Tax=Fusarium venenatum TaxID=56646 RepID=A0A2L2T8X1_9HYPO|nr:uncharacterized protein FVRRES_13289 [Fusarium venenatum]CEI40817.1 unnamed protein product [Fusarium venenatum]